MSPDAIAASAFAAATATYFGALIAGFSTVLYPRLSARIRADRKLDLLSAIKAVSSPGSSCACGRQLSILEKAPVIGWLASRGRCRACGGKVPLSYPVTEAAGTVLFVALASWGITLPPVDFLAFCLGPSILVGTAILVSPLCPRSSAIALAAIGVLAAAVGAASPENVLASLLLPALLLPVARELPSLRKHAWLPTSFFAAGATLAWSGMPEAHLPAIILSAGAALLASWLAARLYARAERLETPTDSTSRTIGVSQLQQPAEPIFMP